MSYLYVALTVVLTVYGQVVLKWQVLKAGSMPEVALDKLAFIANLFLNPWVISGLAAAVLASAAWMAALTKLELSHAYPFMSATFVVVFVLSGILFHEPMTMPKIIGLGLIVSGIIVGSQG